MARRILHFSLAVLLLASFARAQVSFVLDAKPGPAAQHGLRKLKEALAERKAAAAGVVVAKVDAKLGAEALSIRHARVDGKPALSIGGGDDRGLMYALLDVADRVGWAKDPAAPFSEVRDSNEKPAVPERGLSIYTMQAAYFESHLFDEKYWARYFDMLARNRYNSFIVIFGYENAGYMAPAYPYLYDVDGFPDVRVVGQSKEKQKKNYDALKRMIRMAHERGLDFTVGLWDHIYRGGVQGPAEFVKNPTPGLVWGVNEKNLTAYISAALTKFFREFPEVDRIQFRMHAESGLKGAEMKGFWEALYQVMKQHGGRTQFDFRLKDFPDDLINRAVELKLPFRLNTKYWMEQMGLPFHPTHVPRQNQKDRRQSYGDVLRYPQLYKMQWQLWTGGTSRILLWGDPEYARRFAESARLYDGSFEVNEPLATKMEGQPHDARPFDLLAPRYRYYEYEFERYWHFYQVFGRMGYNPKTPAEVWEREFERRFGQETAPVVMQALHRASGVLPRIVASVFPYNKFPTTRGWVEKQRWDDLPGYAKAEGSDTQQFQSFDEAAAALLEGAESAKIGTSENSRWLAQASADILTLAGKAEERAGAKRSKEFDSTMVDLRIVANLALYHARRIPAGVAYAAFNRTKHPADLEEAIGHEKLAIDAWRRIVEAAGDVYAGNLMFGLERADLTGHWRDELAALNKGLAKLEEQRAALPATTAAPRRSSPVSPDREPPVVRHAAIASAPASQPLAITAQVEDPAGVKWVRLRYRAVNQYLDFDTLEMRPTGKAGEYRAVVPGEQIGPKHDFMYLIEAMDNAGNGRIFPDLESETPYVIVRLARQQ